MLVSEEPGQSLPKDQDNEESKNIDHTSPSFLIRNVEASDSKLDVPGDERDALDRSKLQGSYVNTNNVTNGGFLLDPQDIKSEKSIKLEDNPASLELAKKPTFVVASKKETTTTQVDDILSEADLEGGENIDNENYTQQSLSRRISKQLSGAVYESFRNSFKALTSNNAEYLSSGTPGLTSEIFDRKISKCVEKFRVLILIINLGLFALNVYSASGLQTSVNRPAILKKSNPI